MKIKILPNKKQETELVRYAHAARYAYNWALRKEQEAYRKGKTFLIVEELQDTFNQLKKVQRYQWLCDIPQDILNLKIKEAAYAYKNFLCKASNCPRFKKKENDIFSFGKEKTKMFLTDTYILIEDFNFKDSKMEQGLNQIKFEQSIKAAKNELYGNIRFLYKESQWYIVLEEIKFRNNTNQNNSQVSQLLMKQKHLKKRKHRIQHSITRKYEKNKKGNTYCKTKNILKKEKELDKLNKRLTNIQHQINVFNKNNFLKKST